MKDLKVGYLRGRLFGATETDHKLIAVEDSYPAAFKLLQKGQVDCLVMIDEVAQAILKKQGIDKKIIRSGDFSTIPIYHHIHKKNQKYFNQIKDAIAKEFSKNK